MNQRSRSVQRFCTAHRLEQQTYRSVVFTAGCFNVHTDLVRWIHWSVPFKRHLYQLTCFWTAHAPLAAAHGPLTLSRFVRRI